MKRIISFLLVLALAFSMVACGAKEEPQTVVAAENSNGQLDVGDIGSVDVEENLFSVEITVPADFLEEGITQDSLDQQKKEAGWKNATLNADGSVTYVMTKAQHAAVMDELKQSLEEAFDSMIGSAEYPNVVSIKANDDFTDFEIVTKNESTDFAEMFSVFFYYMTGAMYNIYNGTPVDNVTVKFINEISGAVIEEYNSKDMETTAEATN